MITEQFKRYLEGKFRAISPTKAAADFRKRTLKQMEEYAQDLRIKGLDDEDIIFKLCVESLGDFDKTLADFEAGLEEEKQAKSKTKIVYLSVFGGVLGLFLVYVLLGVFGGWWHPAWLVPVCGVLIGGAAGAIIGAVVWFIKKKNILARLAVACATVLGAVALFLLFNILSEYIAAVSTTNPLPYTYFIFLVMVCLVLIGDTIIAFLTKSKLAFWEALVSFLVTVVLIYVMVGIPSHFWHPGWLMILFGVVADLVAIGVKLLLGRNKKMKELRAQLQARRDGVDEKYYTEW